ncbi:TetR/AcrR family transcriptional regulator C-terminal domain-containing protein [Rhodococcus sp. 14-2483-1-2]|uniref:TetR/AcrR family transcriptional regulator n=1 Tax=Rhodococcus sp. 14-2483-1-2 TaxID=2023147 RepID=UPI000B9B5594|nr:TetR/AcrR family transcriptional regulator C-terminal domain-containing protein [Rhodococcus sp. 14-2483-1-2]OZF26093.1 hypothetical protein CH295_26050 [Rhodococcus sp. 14-2483-1-2]
MTREVLIDAAVSLTEERGLSDWTTRELAASLDTSLSVVAHHVGDRSELSAAVVDRVSQRIAVPPQIDSWQEWLRELLIEIRSVFVQYPGVAQWALVHGPVTPAIAPILERAVSVLLDAGFGDNAARAYTVVFTTCMSHIAIGDSRSAVGRDHRSIRQQMPADRGPGLDAVADLIDSMSEPGGITRHYIYALDCLLGGIDATRSR